MTQERLSVAALVGLSPEDLVFTRVQPAVTMTQLAFYCAAVGVTDPIHYDRSFARDAGFPDAVVNGSLRVAWMAQALHELVLPHGWLAQLQCSHRGMMLAGEVPTLEVRYLRHTDAADGTRVELAVKTLVADRVCDTGSGTVFIPLSSA
jgi:acyl dehydratase